jgi:hypothetical protein
MLTLIQQNVCRPSHYHTHYHPLSDSDILDTDPLTVSRHSPCHARCCDTGHAVGDIHIVMHIVVTLVILLTTFTLSRALS